MAQKIDLNRASINELATIPGVGRICAARIVSYRESRGGFKDLSDLDQLGLRRNVLAPLKTYVQI